MRKASPTHAKKNPEKKKKKIPLECNTVTFYPQSDKKKLHFSTVRRIDFLIQVLSCHWLRVGFLCFYFLYEPPIVWKNQWPYTSTTLSFASGAVGRLNLPEVHF